VARRVSSPEFVGRGPELGALLDALERATDGSFGTVFLDGESGVGKSRLLQELERAAVERGACVLAGDCVALAEGELPYAPIRSPLRGLTRELDADTLDAVLGPARGELARLVPELAGGMAVAPPESAVGEPLAQSHLFELLLGVFARLAETTPVVLAVEDIHWADRSTLNFLAFLISTARRERLLLVCTYRTDAVHREHPLRAFLAQQHRPRSVERVHLDAFTPVELGAQLHGILGSPPEAGLVKRLFERTEGNAFFTEELLAASGDGADLPASLRDALLLRIEVLPDDAQQVLRVAAAHGRFVPDRLLAAVCELPEPELHEAVRAAVAHHVLVQRDQDTYAFRHALVHETLAADLLPGERTNLHLALAQVLERDPSLVSRDGRAAAELYRHWLGAQRLEEALAAAVRAGIEAEQIYAFAEASGHFQSALELWGRTKDAAGQAGMDRGALDARAARSAHLGGDGPQALLLIRAAIDEVDAQSEPYRAAVLRERLGRYLFLASGDTAGALNAYQQAIDLLPASKPRAELARVHAALGQMLMLRGQTVESQGHCEQAIAVAKQVGARAEEAHALNTLGVNLVVRGDRSTGIAHLREALRMTEELGDIDSLGRAYANLSDALDEDGQFARSVEIALEGADRAQQLGIHDYQFLLRGEAAARAFKMGQLDETARLTESALDIKPSLARLAQTTARARVEIQRGRLADAEQLVAAANEDTSGPMGSHWIEPAGSANVQLELLRGDPVKARRLGEQTLERAADHETVAFTARLYALTARAGALLAERARAARDDQAATDATGRIEALVARIRHLLEPQHWLGSPPAETLAYAELTATECRRAAGKARASDWAAVAGRWTEIGLPLDEAYARLREAECHLLEGERNRAEDALAVGVRITRDCGATWLHEQLQALARRGRLPLPDDDSTDEAPVADQVEGLGLTERELAVLELVARGMTNREIGEHLFMAEKTASVHVSRILAKLDVSSRVEAATAAQRLGIVP
jgi:DNA-binding CsgD family transcriptional regulator/tetratricopeptide (TPR) repeat protein